MKNKLPPLEARKRIGVDQFAELLDISTVTLRRRIKAGAVPPPKRDGRLLKWEIQEIEKHLRK
jgi:hypothetical protein